MLRLPNNTAIEFAIVHGLVSDTLRAALSEASHVRGMTLPPDFATLEGNSLEKKAIDFIKANALHAAIIDALPFDELPALLVLILTEALKAARGDSSGFIQL